LQEWPSDPYEAIVYCPESPEDRHQDALEGLRRMVSSSSAPANLIIRTVGPNADGAAPAQVAGPASIALKYPATAGVEAVAWSGPLDPASVSALISSPARRELGGHLVTGKAIVWVLLESGDGPKDKAAAAVLGTALAASERRVAEEWASEERWKERDGATESDYSAEMPKSPSPQFFLVRVSRSDPAEEAFIGTLANCAPGLSDRADEPMAFPVFGRGRVLDVLVGHEINAELIGQVNSFLCSPCSCMIKARNPGLDLLMAVDWEAAAADVASESHVSHLPPAGGFVALTDSRVSAEAAYETDQLLGPHSVSSPAGSLARNTMLALFAVAAVIVAATVALPRWRRRRMRY
jgi:hypothetical protein